MPTSILDLFVDEDSDSLDGGEILLDAHLGSADLWLEPPLRDVGRGAADARSVPHNPPGLSIRFVAVPLAEEAHVSSSAGESSALTHLGQLAAGAATAVGAASAVGAATAAGARKAAGAGGSREAASPPGSLPRVTGKSQSRSQSKGKSQGQGQGQGQRQRQQEQAEGEALAQAEAKARAEAPAGDASLSGVRVTGPFLGGKATTVMLRNLPNRYTRDMLASLLHDHDFRGCYDFLYLPVDFLRHINLGYAFLNLVTPEDAMRVGREFDGFCGWCCESAKVCEVFWAFPHQGLRSNLDRLRNSPVMHKDVPQSFKPLFMANGEPAPFPPPTKKVRAPKIFQAARVKTDAAAAQALFARFTDIDLYFANAGGRQ